MGPAWQDQERRTGRRSCRDQIGSYAAEWNGKIIKLGLSNTGARLSSSSCTADRICSHPDKPALIPPELKGHGIFSRISCVEWRDRDTALHRSASDPSQCLQRVRTSAGDLPVAYTLRPTRLITRTPPYPPIWCSSNQRSTPMWAKPSAPPPFRTRPILGLFSGGAPSAASIEPADNDVTAIPLMRDFQSLVMTPVVISYKMTQSIAKQ